MKKTAITLTLIASLSGCATNEPANRAAGVLATAVAFGVVFLGGR